MGKGYPPKRVLQTPVWIAWFDDLDRVQVQSFTPLHRNANQYKFVGRMEMFGNRMIVAATPRIAETKEAALRALLAEYMADLAKAQDLIHEATTRINAIDLVLGGIVRKETRGR